MACFNQKKMVHLELATTLSKVKDNKFVFKIFIE